MSGATATPVATLQDEHGGTVHIWVDDGCYVLGVTQNNGRVAHSGHIFPEAFEVMKTLPSLMAAPPPETFSDEEIVRALEQFLEFGEATFQRAHRGYYAGSGWAARCLRYHLEQMRAK